MARIRVNPITLLNASLEIGAHCLKLLAVSTALKAALPLARTYPENSFGPRVRPLINSSITVAVKLRDFLKNLSESLKITSERFKDADQRFTKSTSKGSVLGVSTNTGNKIKKVELSKNVLDRMIQDKKRRDEEARNRINAFLDPFGQKSKILDGIKDSKFKKTFPPLSNLKISGSYGLYLSNQLHNGVDLIGNKEIRSMTPGKVVYAGDKKDELGNHVVIKSIGSDGKTYFFTYAHLASYSVKSGDSLNGNENIGVMGKTGLATGVHLHLAINEEGKGTYTYLQQFNDPVKIKPDSKIPKDPGERTYQQEMNENWVDPTPYVNGKGELSFKSL